MISTRYALSVLTLAAAVYGGSLAVAADAEPPAALQPVAPQPKEDEALKTFLQTLAAYEDGGDYETVIKFSRIWQKTRPLDAQVWFVQGRAHFYDGDYSAAIASWEQSQQLDSKLRESAPEWINRARALKQGWGDQSSLLLTDNEITIAKREWEPRGRALLDAKNYDEIERVAAQLTASGQDFADGTWALTFFANGITEPPAGRDTDAQWEAQLAGIEAWTQARPDSDFARVCLARIWSNGAWRARGYGYGWPEGAEKTIEERNNKTLEVVEGAGGWTKLMAKSPLSFEVFHGWAMLTGRAADPTFYHQQLDATTAAFPRFADAYKRDAHRLLARWYGKKDEWQQKSGVHADAYAKEFGAPAGDALYAQIVWRLSRSYVADKSLWTDEATDWPRTKRGIQSIVRDNPDSLAAQTFLFDVATTNEDWPSALQALQKLNGRVDGEYYLYRRKEFAPQRVAVLEHSLPQKPTP